MKLQTETQKIKKGLIKSILLHFRLKKVAKALVRGASKSKAASAEILYSLPGVFSMSIVYGLQKVRLIKEADELRIMDTSEKAKNLLTLELRDERILSELSSHEVTWQKAISEHRISFVGKTRFLTCLMRVAAEADRVVCSESKYDALYGKKEKEDA